MEYELTDVKRKNEEALLLFLEENEKMKDHLDNI